MKEPSVDKSMSNLKARPNVSALQSLEGATMGAPQQLGSRGSSLSTGLSAALLKARLSLQTSAEGELRHPYLYTICRARSSTYLEI